MQTRLQKVLSAAGISSRRASEALILEGRVSVNGKTVTELGSKADPDTDDIRVDGRRVKPPKTRRYILMYKPRGYITSRSDPEQRPTVIDLLAKGGVCDYVYPVGRLDYESEGLLILTSDGDLAERLMHPSHEVGREYHVRVRGVPDEHALDRLARGIVIDGRKTSPAQVDVLKIIEGTKGDDAVLSIEIHEGRNRQVRRMCEAVGHPVVRLRRVRIGPIHDEHIRPGEFRDLDDREVAALKRVAAKSRGSSLVARSSGVGRDKAGVQIAAPNPARRGIAAAPPRKSGDSHRFSKGPKTVAVPVSPRPGQAGRRREFDPQPTGSGSRAPGPEQRIPVSARRAGSPKSASGPRTHAPRPTGRPRRA